MGKPERFKARCTAHGQLITICPFSANPTGTYLDTPSGYPDPESGTYPGTVPTVTYGTGVAVYAFVQPSRWKDEGGQMYAKNQHGEEIAIDLIAHVPGDQSVTVRDKVVYLGVSYEVKQIRDWGDGSTIVYRQVELQKMTE